MMLLSLFMYVYPVKAAKYALLIGINDYSSGIYKSLNDCLNDIELMEQVLTRSQFGFLPHNIIVLRNRQAAHADVIRALEKLAASAQKNDTVYIHYSGYGSLTCDLNGDGLAGGKDSTLVSFGVRAEAEIDSVEYCEGDDKRTQK
jgi:hypothetical protein